MGHILERSPGNILSGLYNGDRQRERHQAHPIETETAETYHTQTRSETPYRGSGNGMFGHNVDNSERGHTSVFQTETQDDDSEPFDALSDSGTDTDTESSCADGQYDFSDLDGMTMADKQETLFAKMKHHKGRWRQFMRKPVRNFL